MFHQLQHISLGNECRNTWEIFRARGIFGARGIEEEAGTAVPSGQAGSARSSPGRSLLQSAGIHYFPVIQGTGVVVAAPTPALGLRHHLTPQIIFLHGGVWNTGLGHMKDEGQRRREG